MEHAFEVDNMITTLAFHGVSRAMEFPDGPHNSVPTKIFPLFPHLLFHGGLKLA